MTVPAIAAQQDPSIWTRILGNLPHDPAAVFIYLLVAAAGVWLWRANREQK